MTLVVQCISPASSLRLGFKPRAPRESTGMCQKGRQGCCSCPTKLFSQVGACSLSMACQCIVQGTWE